MAGYILEMTNTIFIDMKKGYILNQILGIDTEKHLTTFARNGNVFSGGVMQFVNLSNTFHISENIHLSHIVPISYTMQIEKEKTIDHILYKPWKASVDSHFSIEPDKCYNPLPNHIEDKKYNHSGSYDTILKLQMVGGYF